MKVSSEKMMAWVFGFLCSSVMKRSCVPKLNISTAFCVAVPNYILSEAIKWCQQKTWWWM